MSMCIDARLLLPSHCELLQKELSIEKKEQKGFMKKKWFIPKKEDYILFHVYEDEEDKLYIPIWFANYHNLPIYRRELNKNRDKSIFFVGTLSKIQKKARDEALACINIFGTVLLNLHVGFGKTVLSLYLASKTSKKVLILTHLSILKTQWMHAVKKFCPDATCIVYKSNSSKLKVMDADIVISSPVILEHAEKSILESFGCVIVDEIHLMVTDKRASILTKLTPDYVIALSATPYRTDGMDKIIHLCIGHGDTYTVTRPLHVRHEVKCVRTGFKPECVYIKNMLSWNHVIHSICDAHERTEMLCNPIFMHPERRFLILTKRIQHADTIASLLTPHLTVYKVYDTHIYTEITDDHPFCVVATISKAGTGFDCPKLDSLILACDCENYFIQYFGRITRRPDVQPLVYDFVDDHSVLEKHWSTRKKIYRQHGGSITFHSYSSILFDIDLKKVAK